MIRQKIAAVVCFVMPFLFAWILVGQIIQSRLTIDKLVKVTGIVSDARVVTTKVKKRIFYTHKDTELRIYLMDTPEYFRIMEIYKYGRFLGAIKRGDTAEIYIRPKWLIPLGFGYRNDVFQIKINGKVLLDISETHKNEYGIMIVSIIAIPLFILLGKWTKRRARRQADSLIV